MQIDIPKTEQDRLAQNAIAAGYQDVQAYVTEHLLALAYQPSELNPLSPAALEASLKNCDDGRAQAKSGLGMSLQEALRQSHAHLRNLER